MSDWVSEYVGIPYLDKGRTREGLDCLGLFILLNYERLGRRLPDPYCTVRGAIRRRVAVAQMRLYQEVSVHREGDAVLIRQMGFPTHVGYCIGGGMMLHADGPRGVVCENYTCMKWKNRVVGVFRYVGTE